MTFTLFFCLYTVFVLFVLFVLYCFPRPPQVTATTFNLQEEEEEVEEEVTVLESTPPQPRVPPTVTSTKVEGVTMVFSTWSITKAGDVLKKQRIGECNLTVIKRTGSDDGEWWFLEGPEYTLLVHNNTVFEYKKKKDDLCPLIFMKIVKTTIEVIRSVEGEISVELIYSATKPKL
jgi:hypothetical protein